MFIELNFFRSKIARRIFILFIVSSFLPVLLLTGFSQSQIHSLIQDQATNRVNSANTIYGSAVHDRLILASQTLREITPAILSELGQDIFRERAAMFKRITISGLSGSKSLVGSLMTMPTLTPQERTHLREGRSLLRTVYQFGKRPEVQLILSIPTKSGSTLFIQSSLDPDYLWGEKEILPWGVGFCVTNAEMKPLFCTLEDTESIISALASNASKDDSRGVFTWDSAASERHIASYREIFLAERFHADRWLVVATQPERVTIETFQSFNIIFWSSITLTVLMVMLLSTIHIRRTLIPLENLIKATRQLAKNDFSARVEIATDDEFAELSETFNTAAAQLGEQFEVLSTRSAIDREILSNLDLDNVARIVLHRLTALPGCWNAGLLVMNKNVTEQGTLWIYDPNLSIPQVIPCLPQEIKLENSTINKAGFWIETHTPPTGNETSLEGRLGTPYVFILPTYSKEQVTGAILLGYQKQLEFTDQQISQIKELADHVGVALSMHQRESQLYLQAHYDALTGLPNRFLLVEKLNQDISRARREKHLLALLFLDLDRFKRVNDSLGHSAGDELLKQASDRLKQCLRTGDTVARFGGDEFAVILHIIPDAHAARAVAEHINEALLKVFSVAGVDVYVNSSIGISIFPTDGTTAQDLLRYADTAMYRAKELGRGTYVFFEESMNTEVVRRTIVERELRQAIDKKQLLLYYQPQFDLRQGGICGAEALIRWRHPERGILSPGEFIDIAEDTGLIIPIGNIVLREACRQFAQWHDEGMPISSISVNVSTLQLMQGEFISSACRIFSEYGIPPGGIELEITESIFVEDFENISKLLDEAKCCGFKISIDDFGTGYSSLSYLEKLPFDVLKIDQSFVRGISAQHKTCMLPAAIIGIARSLNKTVVAEGVETEVQLRMLSEMNCDIAQGYYFSRPVSPEDFIGLIKNGVYPLRSN